MDPNLNDFEDEETEEEKQEIGEGQPAAQDLLPIVGDLPGQQDLRASVTILDAEIPVHVAVKPKLRLLNQMEGVVEFEEEVNPIAEVQQWVLKDALRKHYSYANIFLPLMEDQTLSG